jgi:hypothetical protein
LGLAVRLRTPNITSLIGLIPSGEFADCWVKLGALKVKRLAGKHRGRVARVYGNWQCETIRVDLGPEAKEAYADIFAAYQLLRMEGVTGWRSRPSGEPVDCAAIALAETKKWSIFWGGL